MSHNYLDQMFLRNYHYHVTIAAEYSIRPGLSLTLLLHHDDGWGEQVEKPIGFPHGDLLLEQEFDPISQRLQQPPWTHPVGPQPVLDPGGYLPLEEGAIGHR